MKLELIVALIALALSGIAFGTAFGALLIVLLQAAAARPPQ